MNSKASSQATLTLAGNTPTCPRCGYDLRVSTQLWPEGSCPVHGMCNECGLEFEWGEVLNPARIPVWLPEHHPRSIRSLLKAIPRTLVPWSAMRSLLLSLPVRPAAALLAPLVMLVAVYALGILAVLLVNVLPGRSGVQYWTPSPSLADALWWPWRCNVMAGSTYTYRRIASVVGLVVLVHALLMPASFLTLRVTLKRITIQRSHFIRLAALSMIPVLAIALFTMGARVTLDALEVAGLYAPGYRMQRFLEWEAVPWLYDSPLRAWPTRYFLVYAVWSLVYWWSACRWYLRLPSPLFHACLLFIVASLLTTAALFFVSSPFERWFIALLGVVY